MTESCLDVTTPHQQDSYDRRLTQQPWRVPCDYSPLNGFDCRCSTAKVDSSPKPDGIDPVNPSFDKSK